MRTSDVCILDWNIYCKYISWQ